MPSTLPVADQAATALDVEVLRKPFGIYLLLSGASLVWPGKGQ